MGTRIHSVKRAGSLRWTPTTSHALCDFCGKEDETAHMGRVTAPLPEGWLYSEEPTKSGKSVRMLYSCGCKAAS